MDAIGCQARNRKSSKFFVCLFAQGKILLLTCPYRKFGLSLLARTYDKMVKKAWLVCSLLLDKITPAGLRLVFDVFCHLSFGFVESFGSNA